jgi:hypothetical protein
MAEAAARVDHLQRQADGLGAFLDAQKQAFVEVAEAALAHLDELQTVRRPPPAEEPLDHLHSVDRPSAAAVWAPDGDAAPAA